MDPSHVAGTTIFISLQDAQSNNFSNQISQSSEAIQILFVVPVESHHQVGVELSIIPFSLDEHPNQVFHSTNGVFFSCCGRIEDDEGLLPLIVDAAETIYKAAVPWHSWNFRAAGFWEKSVQTSGACVEGRSCWDKINELPKQRVGEACSSEHGCTKTDSALIRQVRVRDSRTSQCCQEEQHTCIETAEPRKLPKRKRKHPPTTITGPEIEAANSLLEHFSHASVLEDKNPSFDAFMDIWNTLGTPCNENTSRAWEVCVAFVTRTGQQLNHGRFLRFLSLCFFLIWEKCSEKQGKSAARMINTKMREAGFSGHSRSFKTMRDETILINRIISSIQQSCHLETAGSLYHIIFDASNYQSIRTINRLGNDKKSRIIGHICKHVDRDSVLSSSKEAFSVQHIIQQYLPNLSADVINSAIGYQTVATSRAQNFVYSK
ncbi:hypothetical protein BS50DRAFT_566662 [Corynespora cassiicola Philippines]|uniref:Uncharacterized protein n=1 Tax=Corynespora cassiicola Philippines TaxID=1448308 RepID=A0A2T2MZE1_CORCC|nr:hypothetical protein BS50DRAFT_566662 [Corynespora cassiicola Philippines]